MMSKKILLFGTILVVTLSLIIIRNINTKAYEEKRKESVQTYIKCLNENFGQRYDCAEQQGQHYLILDQAAEKEGYTFSIDKHYNLVIHKKGE